MTTTVLIAALLAFALASAARAGSPPPGIPRSPLIKWPSWHPNWWQVGHCEEGVLPGGGIDWKLVGTTYSGGLGFYNQTWASWAKALGLLRRFPFAGDAPPAVQIEVAEYGWERGGYWGSLHNGCAG